MSTLNLSSDEFRVLANRVTELAAELLAELPDLRAFPQVSGRDTSECFGGAAPEVGLGARALDALEDVITMSRPPSPRRSPDSPRGSS